MTGVFDTYELLEEILLNLFSKNLFDVQRVSRTWKSVIEQSHSLQQTMFLLADGRPVTPSGTEDDAIHYGRCPRLNPVMGFSINGRENHADVTRYDLLWVSCYVRYSAPFEKGMAANLWVVIDLMKDHGRAVSHATCNDMYLTQPPITAIDYPLRGEDGCTIYDPRGITLKGLRESVAIIVENRELHAPDDGNTDSEDDYDTITLHFSIDLRFRPDEYARKRAYEQCTDRGTSADPRGSCTCTDALFGPRD